MPQDFDGWLSLIGAFCFGIVIGWVTYRTLRRYQPSGLTDIATVIGAVGGAAITGIWKPGTGTFGAYCIGLLLGFFGYLKLAANASAPEWMGSEPPHAGSGSGGSSSGGRI
jgi:uncharacterized membrane protein YeaQ/YmgE (transglycosylase-associated protein family)